jgi:copper homeostasis protein
MPILLEVCVASVEDALVAEEGGAARLELSPALALGGLTPSLGLLIEVKQAVSLPVIALVRPRAGGFSYSSAEFLTLRRDVDLLLAHGADGIAFGILFADGRIDRDRCRELVRRIGEQQTVFHRAFDVTPDPFKALEMLVDLGVKRVLTSGQEATAPKGVALIAELIRRSAGRIEVLPGGGINRFTAAEVVRRTGCNQLHASLRGQRVDRSTSGRPLIVFENGVRNDCYEVTDREAVKELCELLRMIDP